MGIEHLNLQLATTNMKQFIILSVCLASAMAFKSYNMAHKHDAREAENHDNCVDISYYDDGEYNSTVTKMCGYKKNTHCVPRQTQVCRDIPITECRIVGFTECEETPYTQTVSDDGLELETFVAQDCHATKPISYHKVSRNTEEVTTIKRTCRARAEP